MTQPDYTDSRSAGDGEPSRPTGSKNSARRWVIDALRRLADRLAWLGSAFRGPQGKATVALVASLLLCVTWKCFGSPERYLEWFDGWSESRLAVASQSAAAVYSFLACFVLLGLVPAGIVTWGFRRPLADFGVRWGASRRTLVTTAIFVPCFLLGGFLASLEPAVRGAYPINPSAGDSAAAFALHCATYLLFYVGWEFHFRGFLQGTLRETMGPANALLVQVAASCLLHFGKPTSEVFGSIGGALLWGLLAYYTRSILSGLAQHVALGVSLDAFLVLCRQGR
jgi:membrane protease YdiL (CAAX protease family)